MHSIINTTFRSLRYRDFRLFSFGQGISLIGNWMQRTAQTWLIYTLTDSPLMVGILGVCQFAPLFLFSLFAGAVTDRFPKKKLLLFTQTIYMLQAMIMTLLTFFGVIEYWHILILSFLFGLTQTLDTPARQSFFVDLVSEKDLTNAISLNSTIFNLARILGPAIAGIVLLKSGMVFCFLINTLSFIPVIFCLVLIKNRPTAINVKNFNIFTEIKDGVTYIKTNETLVINVLITAIVCTFAMNLDVIIPVYAKEVLGGDAHAYSLLLVFAGAGSLIAALMMAYFSKFGVKKHFLLYSGTFTAILQIMAILAHQYLLSAILIAFIGFFNMLFLNTANSIFQLNSTREYRGRVMSIYSFLALGSTPIGNYFSGYVMEKIGGSFGFLFCGFVTAVLLIIVFIIKRRPISAWLFKKTESCHNVV